MKVEQIYTGCLAQGAYYIESGGEAVIIDPLRETQPYLDKLEKEGAKLKYIFETHFHADFVSGHLDLAKKTGATIVYGPKASTDYDIYSAKDGELLSVGEVTFKVLHTPGHTMESSVYLLRDEQGQRLCNLLGRHPISGRCRSPGPRHQARCRHERRFGRFPFRQLEE